jgi:hypothetical protein
MVAVQIMIDRKQSGEATRSRQGRIYEDTLCPRSDLLPQSRLKLPGFHHLPIVYSKFGFISGLNHSLSQSSYDLIASGNTS